MNPFLIEPQPSDFLAVLDPETQTNGVVKPQPQDFLEIPESKYRDDSISDLLVKPEDISKHKSLIPRTKKLYEDHDLHLSGIKPRSPIDVGYVYAPYIPITTVGPLVESSAATQSKFQMCRISDFIDEVEPDHSSIPIPYDSVEDELISQMSSALYEDIDKEIMDKMHSYSKAKLDTSFYSKLKIA